MVSICIIVILGTGRFYTAYKGCAGSYDYAQVECVGTPGALTKNICIVRILMYYLEWSEYNGYKLKKVLPIKVIEC